MPPYKTRRQRRGREFFFHIPGTDFNLELDDTLEIIDPTTRRVNGRMSMRDIMKKFG